MRAQKWWGAVALLPFLLIVGCSQPTSSPAASAAPVSKEAGVYGSFTGVVIDSITKQPLPGVLVEVSTGTGKISDTTDGSGIYTLSGMLMGKYTLSYTKPGYMFWKNENVEVTDKTGYTSETVTIPGIGGASSTTVNTDKDPFYEYAFALQELASWLSAQTEASKAQAPFGGAITPGGTTWTYNTNNGYTLNNPNGGDNILTVTVNEDKTLKVNYSDKAFGKKVWYYSQNMTLASMAPLSGALSGKITVNFAKANNDASVLATAPIQGGVKVWAVDTTGFVLASTVVDPPTYTGVAAVTAGNFVVGSQYTIATAGTTNFAAIGAASNAVGTIFTATGVGAGTGTATVLPDLGRYGPAVTDGAGNFTLPNLPAGRKMSLWVEPFNQANGAVTYYIAGPANNGSGGVDAEKSGSTWVGDYTTQHNVTISTGRNLNVYSFDDKAILLEHNIGVINNATPLSVDATVQPGLTTAIVLKFNKAIETDSFKDTFIDTDGNGTYNSGTDYYLDDTWSTDSLTVTLKPRAYLNNAKGSQLPYGLNGTATLVIPSTAHSVDGYTLQYAGYTGTTAPLAPSATGDKRLKIYTEDPIKVTNVRFLDSTGTTPIEYQNTFDPTSVANWKLPLDGVVEITFDKPLAAAANQKVYLYSWTDTDGDGKLDASEQPTVSTLQDLVAKANTPTVTGSVLTFSFSKLSTNKRYAVGLYALSTRPFDSPAANQYVGFQASDGVKLISTNLYKDQSTLYYKDKPSATTPYFATPSDLILTFDRTFPAGTTAAVELYEKSDLTALWNQPILLEPKRILPVVTVGTTTVTINPPTNLKPATAYSLAVKLLRADGTELFYTKSTEFFDNYSVGGAVASVVGNEVVMSQNADNSSGNTSYYIGFTTDQLFAPVARYVPGPATATNIASSQTSVKVAYTTGTWSTDAKGDAAITIQFNKPIATPVAGDVVLYYWDDSLGSTPTTVEAKELFTVTSTATVSGSVLTVTPAGVLAPGKAFALKLKLSSSTDANDMYVADSFYTIPYIPPYVGFAKNNHLVFKTDAALIPLTTAQLATAKITTLKAVDSFTTVLGVDASQSTLDLSFDPAKKIWSAPVAYYRVYHKLVGVDTDWVEDTGVAASGDNFSALIGSRTITSVPIPDLYPDATYQSGIHFGNTVQYLVTAWDGNGFQLQSDVIAVTDTVKPLAQFNPAINNNFADGTGTAIVAGVAIPTVQVNGVTAGPNLTPSAGPAPYNYTNGIAGDATVYYDLPFDNASGEVIQTVVVTSSFNDTKVTAAFYNPSSSTTGGIIRITIPGGAYLRSGDTVSVTFKDTSGNLNVTNRNTNNPTAATLVSRAVP